MTSKSALVTLAAVLAGCSLAGCSSQERQPASRSDDNVVDKPRPDASAGRADASAGRADASGGTAVMPDASRVATEPGSQPEPPKPSEPSVPDAAAPMTSATGSAVPCDVASILEQYCVQCHGKLLRLGAPFSLVDATDFQRELGGQNLGAAVLRRVQDDTRPMPPPPAPRLDASAIATLERWIAAGAPAETPGCKVDDMVVPPVEDSGTPGVVVIADSAAADSGSQPEPADASVAPRDAAADAAEPAPEPLASDWPMFGFDLANSRNNVQETVLSADNVAALRELWRFNGPSTTSAPAVVDGVAYLPGWDGRVYAMRLEDGSAIWTASLPDLIDSSPTVTASQVFVSDDNGSVHALDRATGAVQWSRSVDGHAEAHLWSSPIYVPSAGLVVLGVASGEEQTRKTTFTFRGSVIGLDAISGNERWRFQVASAESGSGPGVGVWGTAAVDEVRKLVFIGTGNNYQPPFSEYSDSLLAIQYETGQLAWSRQFTANDAYTIYGAQGVDYDIGSSANLFSADGRDFVGVGIKSGNYFALDRDTGEVAWQTTITAGSVLGGVISASAYAEGLIFVASNNFVFSSSTAVAIDARSGDILWRTELSNLTYGGVAHANGVVFVGSTAGTIYAFNAITGDALWVDQTPGNQPIAGSPTVAGGRLLVPWGYQWTLREGNAGRGGLTVYGL